jgi:hypothetical protein
VGKDVWQARFIAPMLDAGADPQTAQERAAQRVGDLNLASLLDHALLAAYRRQQELSWIEQLVEDIETALEETGVLGRPERVPAICFLDPPPHRRRAGGGSKGNRPPVASRSTLRRRKPSLA